jgi:type VI secretion system FHA domain protein
MRRAGAIYQQTVIGLATLMADRARLRDEALCDLTVINAADNNPFKWSATRTLAEDLLRPRDGAFLADADAVRASFEDLAQHMSAVFKAANAAADLVLHALAPDAIEAEARPQASLLQGRSAACWQAHNRRYAELAKAGGGDTPMRRAFASAYSEAIRPTSERPTTLARRARA